MLTFNHERYVGDAISSVMHQQCTFDIELVIGDDCSDDATVKICEEWQSKYPDQIKVLSADKNQGFQKNFIRTYNECNGDYIAICEGDDYWIKPYKLQRQVDFLDNNRDYSTCIHRVINYYEDDNSKRLSNSGQKASTTINELSISNYISNVSALFRRGLFGEMPKWMENISTYDYAIHLMNAEYGDIYYMSQPMAVYRKRKGAIWSSSGMEKQYSIAMQVRKQMIYYFGDRLPQITENLRNAYNNNAIALLKYYMESNLADKVDATKQELFAMNPNWSDSVVDEKIKLLTNSKNNKSLLNSSLKQIRVIVSKLIPVPRAI